MNAAEATAATVIAETPGWENIDLRSPDKSAVFADGSANSPVQSSSLPAKLRMEGDLGSWRYMTCEFIDADGDAQTMTTYKAKGSGWYTAVLDLPAGARDLQVRMTCFSGQKVLKVNRQQSNEWVYKDGELIQEIFEFAQGDGVHAVFRPKGKTLRSYVGEAYNFGRAEASPPDSWEWWNGGEEQISVDRCAYNKDRRQDAPRAQVGGVMSSAPARLRMEGSNSCFRYMTVDFEDLTGNPQALSTKSQAAGWFTADLALPKGARKLRVRFAVLAGPRVYKVYRHKGNQWAHEGGEYPQEFFDFEHGDGVNAVFRIQGPSLRSFVAQAWDFGRSDAEPARPWEWWSKDEAVLRVDAAIYQIEDRPEDGAISAPASAGLFKCLRPGSCKGAGNRSEPTVDTS